MKITPKQNILKVKPYIPGKPIEEVKRELGLKSVIKLASNENPYGPSPRVLRALTLASRSVNRYPDGACFYLRKELAARLKVNENQIIFGNGSDEIIVLAVRAYVGQGDEVIVAQPSFLIYEIASLIEGARVRAVSNRDHRPHHPERVRHVRHARSGASLVHVRRPTSADRIQSARLADLS